MSTEGQHHWIRCPYSDLMQRQQAFSYANWRALTVIPFTPRAIVERMLRWVQHQDVKRVGEQAVKHWLLGSAVHR